MHHPGTDEPVAGAREFPVAPQAIQLCEAKEVV